MIPRAFRAAATSLVSCFRGGQAGAPTTPQALGRDSGILESIIENTRTHLAYLDPDFNFLLVNQSYAEGAGYSREELIGRNHFYFFPHPENQAIFERVRDTGERVEFRAKPFEYPNQPWRGTTYWDWTLTPVKDDAGRVQGLVLSLTDVTEEVRAKKLLERAYRKVADLNRELSERIAELRRLQRAKAEYLQVLAHELRNPLSAALGLLQLSILKATGAGQGGGREVGAEPGRAEGVDYLHLAERELKRLQKLVEEIITADRVSSGRLPLEMEPINLLDVLEQAAAPYVKGVHEVNLIIEQLPSDRIPIRGDGYRLVEVLANLLSNSVKYSPPGSTIRLRVVVEGNQTIVQLEDEGIGIPPGQLEEVFEGFHRGSNLSNRHPGGMGLGLYISRDIARRHGGDLWATNRPGGGTIMHLRLPLLTGGAPAKAGP